MKKMITVLLISIVGINGFAQQTNEKELSNAEQFSAKSGTLIQKVFYTIGTIKKCELQVIEYTDLISNAKQKALKLSYDVVSSYSTDTKTAVLDTDEIDGLMKSIKLMQEKVMLTVPTEYTEVSFKSRGGFEAGCFVSKGAWSSYLKLEKYDGKSYVWIDKDDLTTFYDLLSQAKVKMQ
jgi:hypothetical protein